MMPKDSSLGCRRRIRKARTLRPTSASPGVQPRKFTTSGGLRFLDNRVITLRIVDVGQEQYRYPGDLSSGRVATIS